MRGSQSRYLEPLLTKADTLTTQMFSTPVVRYDETPIDLDGFTVLEDDASGDFYAEIETDSYLGCHDSQELLY